MTALRALIPPTFGAALAALVLATSPLVRADDLPPPPRVCPPGHTPDVDHRGPYCRPNPPTGCPVDHVPQVRREVAYCEPPPPKPCPPGSYWMSDSPTKAYCRGGWPCQAGLCRDGASCYDTALCVQQQAVGHRGTVLEFVSGECQTDADCKGGDRCVRAQRCAPPPGTRQPAATPSTGSCVRCAIGRRSGSSAWLLVIAGCTAAFRRRRRRLPHRHRARYL